MAGTGSWPGLKNWKNVNMKAAAAETNMAVLTAHLWPEARERCKKRGQRQRCGSVLWASVLVLWQNEGGGANTCSSMCACACLCARV